MDSSLWVVGALVVFAVVVWLQELRRKAAQYDEVTKEAANLRRQYSTLELSHAQTLAEHEAKETRLRTEYEAKETRLGTEREAFATLVREKTQGFPWLAEGWADYLHLADCKAADDLESRRRPAPITAAEIRKDIAAKRRIAERLRRIYKYQLRYYERLFPWLEEFREEGIDELIEQIQKGSEQPEIVEDPVSGWVTPGEYQQLSEIERNQLALDRYKQSRHSKWIAGRDYERYIGYLYEQNGCLVCYEGAISGYDDLGRDLIVTKDGWTFIIQCKRWSERRVVHEKHIFQLFGTTIKYALDHTSETNAMLQLPLYTELPRAAQVRAYLYTSTSLSPTARKMAKALDVGVKENFQFSDYPAIKCNVSRRTGERIYHLPFDQQYDRTLIEHERNECYVSTVQEAADRGFRRAFRWHPPRGLDGQQQPVSSA